MTLGALDSLSLKARMVYLLVFQKVEDRSLHRIERCELQGPVTLNPSHINVIVEVDRPRQLRRDVAELETGLGEYQYLRTDWDSQVLEG
jgi:hypothetical protein